jgi:hypothetical protein
VLLEEVGSRSWQNGNACGSWKVCFDHEVILAGKMGPSGAERCGSYIAEKHFK